MKKFHYSYISFKYDICQSEEAEMLLNRPPISVQIQNLIVCLTFQNSIFTTKRTSYFMNVSTYIISFVSYLFLKNIKKIF